MISVGMGFPDAEREDMKDISAPHDFPFGELFSPRGIFFGSGKTTGKAGIGGIMISKHLSYRREFRREPLSMLFLTEISFVSI